MADPILTFHDGAGDLIVDGVALVLPTATPNTPTAPTVVEIRNNDVGGPAVDPARNVRFTALTSLQGSGDEPSGELAYSVQRALQVSVTAVSGGATARLRGFLPIGTGRSIELGEIPDGGTVTLEVRTLAPLGASLQDVTVHPAVESIQSVPLDEGRYDLHGNFILDGRPGGVPDPLFFAVRSETGEYLVSGLPDGIVDTPTETIYVRVGVTETWTPSPAELEYDDLDGAAVALVALNAYYVGVTLAAGGTITETKGLQAALPLTDAAKPTLPVDEQLRLWVVVPFGLEIVTLELQDIQGFWDLEVVSGLTVSISAGRGVVDGRKVDDQTRTTFTAPDNQTSTIWRQPESGFETIDSTASPTDPHSMPIWEITTVAGVVTVETDLRRIGVLALGGVLQTATFVVDAAVPPDQVCHVTLRDGIGRPGQVVLQSLEVSCHTSDNAAGNGLSTPVPAAVSATLPQSVRQTGIDLRSFALGSDTAGAIDVTFNESGGPSGDTYFLVVLIGGRKFVSTQLEPRP